MPFTFEEKCFIKVLKQEKGWAINEFVPNFGKRNGLLVRLTIFYGKSTKLVQLSEKLNVVPFKSLGMVSYSPSIMIGLPYGEKLTIC